MIASLVVAFAREARADVSRFVVDLYTIGPSSAFASRFGHSLLCVRKADKDSVENGTCYDYGVADRDDLVHVGWTASRGVPSFMPVTVREPVAVKFFSDQGRQVERQRIPLSVEEAARLVAAMDDDILARRAYAYHPYWANCATRLRDHLDAATNGRLRKGPDAVPKGTFRDWLEEGHSGHIDILAPMALYVGEGNDRAPTPWEAMFLPAVLRDGVRDRLAAVPEKLAERVDMVLPTSRAIGRFAIVALSLFIMVAARIACRRGRIDLALRIVGFALGALAISADVVSLLVSWPEVSHNWALLLLLPTDIALPYLPASRLTTYIRARLALAAVLSVLEIAGFVHQPLLPLAILVALPMSAIHSALRERTEVEPLESTAAGRGVTSS